MTEKQRGMLYVVIATIMMSSGGLLIKSVEANPVTIVVCRAFFAALLFLPFVQWKTVAITKDFAILVSMYILLTVCYVTANRLTTAANAIILQSTAPLWLYLGLLMKGEKKLTGFEAATRGLILLGIVIILWGESGVVTKEMMLGNFLAIIAGIGYAWEQYQFEKTYPMNDVAINGLMNLFMVIIVSLIFHRQVDITQIPGMSWLYLAILGFLQIGISYYIFIKGVRKISASEASVLCLLEPILNPIWVYLFIGEKPTIYTLVGFTVILMGIVSRYLPIIRKEKSRA
ncbi:MAG: DMT family transporter [Eubacteriaceae bacterium]|nr:DMT family transporter [Eubacteriaceae bacterium]